MSRIEVEVQGLGDISSITNYPRTVLETASQGITSAGTLVVRDLGLHPTDFTTGKRVAVKLDGVPIWSGYLLKAHRRFWFDADDSTKHQRQWQLDLADINILFQVRFVYDKSNPPSTYGPKIAAVRYDDTVIADLVANWLDLSADDLDVSSQVHRVASVWNGGQSVYPFNPAMRWFDAMESISQLPAAVYSLNPARQLVYGDVDDENAAFAVSDRRGSGIVTYREFTHWQDGSQLGNDIMAWGAGKGDSANMVFRRLVDDVSVAEHGLWQEGIVQYSIWHQSTIDQLASSYLIGSPSSHRGHRNNKEKVEFVLHTPGLVIGDRVHVISNIWGYEDVVPIRKAKITFPTPTDARFEFTASHEIDRFGFQDPPYNPFHTTRHGRHSLPPDLPGYTTPGGTTVCALRDDLTRTVAGGWGPLDSLHVWATTLSNAATVLADGAYGIIRGDSAGDIDPSGRVQIALSSVLPDPAGTFGLDVRILIDPMTTGGAPRADAQIDFQIDLGVAAFRFMTGPSVDGDGNPIIPVDIFDLNGSQQVTSGTFLDDIVGTKTLHLKLSYDGTSVRSSLYQEGSPAFADVETTNLKPFPASELAFDVQMIPAVFSVEGPAADWVTFRVDYVEATYDCIAMVPEPVHFFDPFNRALVDGWGSPDGGAHTWEMSTVDQKGHVGVDGEFGYLRGDVVIAVGSGPNVNFIMRNLLPTGDTPFRLEAKVRLGASGLIEPSFFGGFEIGRVVISWNVNLGLGAPGCNIAYDINYFAAYTYISIATASSYDIIFRVEDDGVTSRVKAFLVGTAEPDWLSVPRAPWAGQNFLKLSLATGNWYEPYPYYTVGLDYLDLVFDDLVPGGVIETGWALQMFASVNENVTLARGYAPGSVQVKASGMDLTPVVDFIETDPVAGIVSFAFIVGLGHEITNVSIRYLIA